MFVTLCFAVLAGHLARSGGTMTAEFVEFEVTRALEWLQSDRTEVRRLPAVLVLRELAENAPTLLHPHIEVRLVVWLTCSSKFRLVVWLCC